MLSTRLEQKGEIISVEKPFIAEVLKKISWQQLNEETAKNIGAELGADFIVAGSLTQIGDTFSIDTSVIDIRERTIGD